MNLEPPKAEIRPATRVIGGPVTPRKGPPKFKQRQTRQFKSKPPKKGIQGVWG
ncbi:Retinal rod rhodopsin-sensitive cGMP 3',5'-cyclic phosphodiesterase subunit gamma [Lemmus lemmus]